MAKKKRAGRIRFGTYPYTVTRVRVMKSKLLTADDYLRMRKMGVNEAIRFLGESEYKSEIDTLSKEYRGTELIELAMNQNLASTVNKLLEISLKDEVKHIIQSYSMKWVLNNVKMVLRTKMNRLSENELRYSIIPIKPADFETCMKLYRESGEGLVHTLSSITGIDRERIRELYNANNLFGLENEIDIAFYYRLMGMEKGIKMKKTDPLKQFFDHLIQLNNIKNVVRLKKEGINEEIIKKMMIRPVKPTKIKKKEWVEIIKTDEGKKG